MAAIVLDCRSVPRSDEIKALARDLGFRLVFIPPGMTDGCQPLDRAVFGPLKATARRLFREHLGLHADDPQAASERQAAQVLIESWSERKGHPRWVGALRRGLRE
jgi:hypothetical protein